MKIMFFTGGFEYGGAQRVLCNLANYFSEEGNKVVVVMASYAEPTYKLGEKVELVNGLNWNNYFDSIVKLRQEIIKYKPDVIVAFAVQYNIAACIACLGINTKVIVSERNDPNRMPQQTWQKVLRKLTYNFADGFVFQTKDARDYFNARIRKKGCIIPNPLFLEEPIPKADEKKNVVLSASRFVPQKNLKMLVNAFSRAVDELSPWRLDMYGDGDEKKEIEKLVKTKKIQNKVRIYPSTNELHKKMREASIFVLTSNFEGMPNSLMEAMGMRMACISTDCPCGGPRFLINNGTNGILVSVDNEDELCLAIKKLISNDELRQLLATNAVSVREKLNTEVIYKSWKEYIQKIIN